MQKIKNIIKNPIFLVITSLVVGALMVGVAYYFTFQTKQIKEPEIFLAETPEEACSLEFTVGHDTSVPQVVCEKLVNGISVSSANSPAVSVEVGSTITYTFKLKNIDTTKSFNITEFIDAFTSDVREYVDLNTSTVAIVSPQGFDCTIIDEIGSGTEPNPEKMICTTTNFVLAPGEEVTVQVSGTALKVTPANIIVDNIFSGKVVGTNGQEGTFTCPGKVVVKDKVYNAISCEKVITPDTGQVGTALTSNVKLKIREASSATDIQTGEILVEGLSNKVTYKISDPLYVKTALSNTNVNWLTDSVTTTTGCVLGTDSVGSVITCNSVAGSVPQNNQEVLKFTSKIGADAVVGENIVNVAELTIGSSTVTCRDQVAVIETPTEGLTCSKKFIDGNGIIIGNEKKILPGDQFTARIEIKNTGNTTLTQINLVDPLNNTYSSFGAKNLSSLKFVEFANTSDAQVSSKCNLSSNLSNLTCANLVLAKDATLKLDVVLEVRASMKENVEIVNVGVVSVTNSTDLTDNCSASINTGEVEDPDPATHLECQDKACVEVDGAGGDECLEDYHCKYTTCEDEACVTKECDDGSCKSSCLEDDHCAEDRETHLACRNQSCVIVDGAGSNQCSTSSDCSVLTSTNRAVTQVPDTGVFEKTLVVTVAASALIFLGLILATL